MRRPGEYIFTKTTRNEPVLLKKIDGGSLVSSSTHPDNVFNVIYFHQHFLKENVSGLQRKDIISPGDYKIESSITLNNNKNSMNK